MPLSNKVKRTEFVVSIALNVDTPAGSYTKSEVNVAFTLVDIFVGQEHWKRRDGRTYAGSVCKFPSCVLLSPKFKLVHVPCV
jgi:hypothetical protein